MAAPNAGMDGVAWRVLWLTLLLWWPRAAMASETDFLPGNVSWNGYSALNAMAGARGKPLKLVQTLDWGRLPYNAALIVAHPEVKLPLEKVAAFLARGGRLLLADDFGAGGALLERFDIKRVEASPGGVRHFQHGNPNLPIAHDQPLAGRRGHPLTKGVRRVVTNHPAYLRSRLPSLLEFGRGGQQLLVAATVGKGELIALSDPSALINTMMQFKGNRALARNLLRRLAGTGGPILILTGSFRLKGELAPEAAEVPRGSVAAFLSDFNDFLGEINSYALVEAGLRALALVCGCLGLLGLVMLLPMPRRDMDGHWVQAEGSDPSGLEEDVVRYGRRCRGGGAALPAALLREEVEEHLGQLLDAPGPLSTVHPSWIMGRVKQRHGREVAQLCGKLLAALRRVPPAGPEGERTSLTGVSPRALRELYLLSGRLFDAMGCDPPFPTIRESTREDHVDQH